MKNTNVPGRNFLKVTSIIGVAFCTIAVCLLMFILMMIETSYSEMDLPSIWIIELSTLTAFTAFSFFAYIMGIIHSDNLEKAKLLQRLGLIIITLLVMSSIYSLIMYDIYMTTIPMIILDFILPILYVVGATKNRKATVTAEENVKAFAEAGSRV